MSRGLCRYNVGGCHYSESCWCDVRVDACGLNVCDGMVSCLYGYGGPNKNVLGYLTVLCVLVYTAIRCVCVAV